MCACLNIPPTSKKRRSGRRFGMVDGKPGDADGWGGGWRSPERGDARLNWGGASQLLVSSADLFASISGGDP